MSDNATKPPANDNLDEQPDWRPLSAEELQRLRPLILDCEGLSDAACATVRSTYRNTMIRSIAAVARTLERAPTEAETDMIGTAIARYVNAEIIPPLWAAEHRGESH